MRRLVPFGALVVAILAIVVALFASGGPSAVAAPGDVVADRVFGQGNNFTTQGCNQGGVSANSLCGPLGVTVDSLGHVYIADTNNNRVLGYIDPLNTNTTADLVIGQGGSFTTNGFNSTAPTASNLWTPIDVAVDGAGNLYVADINNDRVLEYDAPFANDTIADRVFGQFNNLNSNTPNNGGTSANSLSSPVAVAVDPAGNVYISDRSNVRVLEYNTPLSSDITADRVFGQLGSFTSAVYNNGGITADSLNGAHGVGVDSLGNLYIADQGNLRVLKYNNPIAFDTTADLVFGQLGSFTTNNVYSTSANSIEIPTDAEADGAGNVYIGDTGGERTLSYDDPVNLSTTADVVFGQGGSMTTWGNNTGGLSASSQADPYELSFDPFCNLYIVDLGNNRVVEYDQPPHACVDAPSPTPTSTTCPVPVCTPTPTVTSTPTATSTNIIDACSPGPTCTPTATPCPPAICTPTATPTCATPPPCDPAPTPTPTTCVAPPPCAPTSTPTNTPTDTPTLTPTATLTPTPTSTPTPPIPTLTAIAVSLDCNLVLAGIQTNCGVTVANNVDVGVVITNAGGAPVTLNAFAFEVHNSDRAKARPLVGANSNLDANPDFNNVPGDWRCNPPPPQNDSREDGPAASVSTMYCIQDTEGRHEAPVLGVDGSITVAVIHYQVPPAPGAGNALLSLEEVIIRDATNMIEIGTCAPVYNAPATCNGATLTVSCAGDMDCDGFLDPQQTLHLGPANTNAARDNCPVDYNPAQTNTDGNYIDNSPPYAASVDDKTWPNSDAMGDECDTDDDNDGRSDAGEATGAGCVTNVTDPLLRDTDGDRYLDGAECTLGTNPTLSTSTPTLASCGAAGDADLDKIANRLETCFYNSSNTSTDTDGDLAVDGAKDGCEVASLNADRIVNSLDQGMLASGISGAVPYTASVDINKDGVLNSIDQGLMASFIVPSGQCP